MKILQESVIVIENDRGEMEYCARRNGHIIFHRTPMLTVEQVVLMLEKLSSGKSEI